MSSTALVTGGGGFLATQIILLLVERGFRVRSSVRSPEKGAAWLAKQVVKYPQLASQLEFVIVEDMEKEGSFDEAVKGCDVVFHTASPFHFNFTVSFQTTELAWVGYLHLTFRTTRRRCSSRRGKVRSTASEPLRRSPRSSASFSPARESWEYL